MYFHYSILIFLDKSSCIIGPLKNEHNSCSSNKMSYLSTASTNLKSQPQEPQQRVVLDHNQRTTATTQKLLDTEQRQMSNNGNYAKQNNHAAAGATGN